MIASACSRSDDDLPPPIPLPAQPQNSPEVRPPAHAPQTEQDPPKPWVPVPMPSAKPSASATPSAVPSADPSAVPSVTPYAIPYPLVPKLPAVPQIPGLPSIPGVPTSGPGEPDGKAHVVIYGTRTCPACNKLKVDLGARGIPFDFIDLENPLLLNSPLGQGSADMPASMRNAIPVTRVIQKSGKVVWIQGAEAARVERAYKA